MHDKPFLHHVDHSKGDDLRLNAMSSNSAYELAFRRAALRLSHMHLESPKSTCRRDSRVVRVEMPVLDRKMKFRHLDVGCPLFDM